MIAMITRRQMRQRLSLGIVVLAFNLMGNPIYASEAVDNLIATVTELHQDDGFSKVNTMANLVVGLQAIDSMIEGGHIQGAMGRLIGMRQQIQGWVRSNQVALTVEEAMLPEMEALQTSLSESEQPGGKKRGKKP